LIWPVLIAVGVFWLFRSEVRTLVGKIGGLFDRSRVTTVKTPGGLEIEFGALDAAAAIVQESIDETRKEAEEADDPEELHRAMEKLQRESTVLGTMEALRRQTAAEKVRQDAAALIAAEAANPRQGGINVRGVSLSIRPPLDSDDRVKDYLDRVYDAARPRAASVAFTIGALGVAIRAFEVDAQLGFPVEDTLHRLGSPVQLVDRYQDRWESLGPYGKA
jgi:hypothetical protein